MKKILLILLVPAFIFSCKKKEDKKAPTISISINHEIKTLEVCDVMENNVIELMPGDTCILHSEIHGDNTLSQLKIELHDAGDCHSHERPMIEWVYSKIVDLESNHVNRADTIIVPHDAEHHVHHLSLKVLDVEGLASEEKEFNVLVEE